MTRLPAVLLTAALSSLVFVQLSACSGGTWSNNPMIDLSGPHSPSLQGGGGPASVTYPGGPGADSIP